MVEIEPDRPGGLKPEEWERAADVFVEAVALPPEERGAWLAAVLADAPAILQEVVAMLAAHDGPSPLRIEEWLLAPPPPPAAGGGLAPGTRIGPYRVEALVGEGGMGEVYRAERVDGEYAQTVALKLLRAGTTTAELARRFQLERQILARLAHPHIVPILDGGQLPDGRPYLVMRYVDGLPITEYCERNRLALAARLRLFQRVAETVHFAHGRLVVHRDLKPSNILIDATGQPHLLDFGIARILDEGGDGLPREHTRSIVRMLTPEHAAPEQIRGEAVTTATDVYALGVLLFQLLTDRLPYAVGCRRLLALEHAILQDSPPAPSAVAPSPAHSRHLRGDLDRMVLMALRKEPERRYTSAGQFAEDVERYLAGRPVRAQPDTLRYRTRKLVARNRALVSAGATLTLLLIAFAGTTALQARRLADERDRAEEQRGLAEEVVQLLTGLFEQSNPSIVPGGDTLSVGAFVEEGERRVDGLAGQPALQARMWRVLGNMHRARGRYERAIELLGRSHEQQQQLATGGDAELARTYHDLALATFSFRGEAAARPLLDTSLVQLRRVLGEEHPDVIRAMLDRARASETMDERRSIVARAVELQRRVPGTTAVDQAAALHTLAMGRYQRRRFADALALFEQALALLDSELPRDHPDRLTVATNVAASLSELGHWEEAARLTRELLDAQLARTNPDSAALAAALQGWALQQANLGAFAEAERGVRAALAIQPRVMTPDHWRIDVTQLNLALIVAAQGRVREGVELLDSAIARATTRANGVEDVKRAGYYTGVRAMLLLRLGRIEEATRDAEEAARIAGANDPVEAARLAEAERWLAMTAFARGDAATAAERFEAARTMLAEQHPAEHPAVAGMECGAGAALLTLGRRAEAEPLVRRGCVAHQQWAMADPLVVEWGREALRSLDP